jgi:hypothetical protein
MAQLTFSILVQSLDTLREDSPAPAPGSPPAP